MKFGRDESIQTRFHIASEQRRYDFHTVDCTLRHAFENLMRTLGWKVGDTLDIEEDICDVVGQLLMKVEKQDRSNLLDCMQSAIMNIQVEG